VKPRIIWSFEQVARRGDREREVQKVFRREIYWKTSTWKNEELSWWNWNWFHGNRIWDWEADKTGWMSCPVALLNFLALLFKGLVLYIGMFRWRDGYGSRAISGRFQSGSGPHRASCLMCNAGPFRGWGSNGRLKLTTQTYVVPQSRMIGLYLHSPIHLHV
jgi:hypothetical protein